VTPDEAAWVRANVWTAAMLKVETATYPGTYTQCQCQRFDCHQCQRGVHEDCMRQPRQTPEGMVADKSGVAPACFAEPYKHITVDGPWKPTTVAQVWLADRICRWECRCDCQGKRPMSPWEAAWVQDNVWTPAMRKTHREIPAAATSCPCQFGPSSYCLNGRCGDCRPADGYPSLEGYITSRTDQVRFFGEEFEHPTPSATGAQRTRAAQVWLTDRACRWVCPCDCHSNPTFEQDALFDLATSL
jgi:hypothetical protein